MRTAARDLPCIEKCERLVGDKGSRGRCSPCAQRKRREAILAAPPIPCTVDGCERRRKVGLQLCDMHENRRRRGGEVGPAAPKIGPRGGGSRKQDGYHVTKIP